MSGPFSCPACKPGKVSFSMSLPTANSSVSVYSSDAPSEIGAASPSDPVLRAVSYLRVSTREQAERAREREGFSIPAQRQANQKAAHSLGAWVVKEFVDAGASATSAARPQLAKVLDWIGTHRVDLVVVHKLDRLARNRADDVHISQAITEAGARLVSSTEAIDESPSGRLVHGIMASIAEFYSQNLATEVSKGLKQKAMAGGTPNRAPVGYRNVRVLDEQGREARQVEVDEERAQIIRWAFSTYATGEWSLQRVTDAMNRLGFTLPQRAGKPPREVTVSVLQRILRNTYYRGIVTYLETEYAGKHETLVAPELWQRVQEVLTARRNTSTRDTHTHYLKGLLWCGECGSSMMFNSVRNRHGRTYLYFVCLGRHSRRTTCTLKAQQVHHVERAVHELIQRISLTRLQRQSREKELLDEANATVSVTEIVWADLKAREVQLQAEQNHVLHAYYADAITLDLLKREQERIRYELLDIAQRRTLADQQRRQAASRIHEALSQLEEAAERFNDGDDQEKLAAIRGLFTHLNLHPEARIEAISRMALSKC